MEKINEECKLAGNIQPFMFFQYKNELVTNLLYIFHILITPSAIIGIWKYDHLGLGYISSMVEIKRNAI